MLHKISLWQEHQGKQFAHKLGFTFGFRLVLESLHESHQLFPAYLGVGNLSASKLHRDLDLVFFVQELPGSADFG